MVQEVMAPHQRDDTPTQVEVKVTSIDLSVGQCMALLFNLGIASLLLFGAGALVALLIMLMMGR